tara:strand:- start:12 stop:206 length:195 start_codon:yes stop_codon:yes gene_type:complete
MKRIYSLPDLQLIRDYTSMNIEFVEDELSRRCDSGLRQHLASYKAVLDDINYQIENHHQVRIVS